jgi:hypothetical protein
VKRILQDYAEDIYFTTDGWRSKAGLEYFAVLVHFIDQCGRLHCYLIGACLMRSGHAHREVYNMLKSLFDDFAITSKVRGGTTDGASYFPKCMELGGWIHLTCVAHALQLVVKKGLAELSVESVVQIRNLVKYFRTPAGARYLAQHQKLIRATTNPLEPLIKLVIDVETRWDSFWMMVSSVLACEASVISACNDNLEKVHFYEDEIVPEPEEVVAVDDAPPPNIDNFDNLQQFEGKEGKRENHPPTPFLLLQSAAAPLAVPPPSFSSSSSSLSLSYSSS